MTRPYQGLSSLAPGVKMRDPGNEVADKMAASSRFATVSEDDFALKCFFFLSLFFEIITCVFILKYKIFKY